MARSKPNTPSEVLGGQVDAARLQFERLQSKLEDAREQSRLAKRRRKEAKQAARRARKAVKRAKAELAEAEGILRQAEAKLAIATKRPARERAKTSRGSKVLRAQSKPGQAVRPTGAKRRTAVPGQQKTTAIRSAKPAATRSKLAQPPRSEAATNKPPLTVPREFEDLRVAPAIPPKDTAEVPDIGSITTPTDAEPEEQEKEGDGPED